MGVGPHSHSHEAASRLPVEHQRNEIALSCTVIERIGGSRIWGYCHPHGSPDAFLEQTEEAIAEAGCPFAFAVRPFDIKSTLADTRRYALPRHNCNAFPHGAVSLGGAESNEPDIRLLTGMRQWGVIATGQHLVDDLSAMVQTPEWGPLRY